MVCSSCTLAAALIPRFTAGISAASSFMIIYIIYRSRNKLSTIYHRIMFGMSLSDILSSAAMFLTTLPMPKELPFDHTSFVGTRLGNRQTCEAQAFFAVLGYSTMFTYNGMLFVYNTCAIVFQMKEEQIVKFAEPLFHLVPVVLGLSVAILPLFLEIYNVSEHDAWCTIATNNKHSTVIALNLVLFIGVIIAIILIMRKVFKLELEIALRRDEHGERNSSLMKAFQSLQNTKVIGKQALAYYISFMVTAGLLLIRALIGNESQAINYLCFILVPLQGFFNLLIFVSHKVYNYRRVYSYISRLGVIKILLRGGAEEPILFSRISLLEGPVIELSDECKNERLYVEKMSGCGVEFDDQSQRDEDGLSGFQMSLVPISNDEHSGHNTDNKSNFSDNRADLSGFSLVSSPLHSKISAERKINLSDDLPLSHFNSEDGLNINRSSSSNEK